MQELRGLCVGGGLSGAEGQAWAEHLEDQHEPLRERMHERMKSPQGKATYARRMHAAETPFGHIKWAMGVRQFLLRGVEEGADRVVVGVYGVQPEEALGRHRETAGPSWRARRPRRQDE